MIVSKVEFCEFITDSQVVWTLLPGKLITETKSVVKQTETYSHLPRPFVGVKRIVDTVGSLGTEMNGEFAEVVAYFGVFAPNRLPCPVDCDCVKTGNVETVGKNGFVGDKAKCAWTYQFLAFIV